VLIHPKLFDLLKNIKLNMKVIEILSVTISAQSALLPITILNFNTISIISILPNLIVVPISGFITVSGFAVFFVSLINLNFSKFISGLTFLLLKFLIKISAFFSNIPFSNISVVTPHIFIIIIYYFLVVIILFYDLFKILVSKINIKKYFKYILLILMLFILVSIIQNVNKDLKIYFIDVGQRRFYFNNNK